MPRGKSTQLQVPSQSQADSTVDDETQATQNTQASKVFAALSKEEKDRKVNELVQYLLVMDQKKVPIKRQDINKAVLKEHSKAFPHMMDEAKMELSRVFGFELMELKGKQKSYILVNQHETSHVKSSEAENQRTGLLMVILSTIFMNGNVINDSVLYHMLRKLGVDIERAHPVFGDVKKLITQEFVRQCYLEMTRQPTSDPPAFEFRWGQRAKLELSKHKCLNFVTEVYGMDDVSLWTSQWQDVQRTEGLGGDEVMVVDE